MYLWNSFLGSVVTVLSLITLSTKQCIFGTAPWEIGHSFVSNYSKAQTRLPLIKSPFIFLSKHISIYINIWWFETSFWNCIIQNEILLSVTLNDIIWWPLIHLIDHLRHQIQRAWRKWHSINTVCIFTLSMVEPIILTYELLILFFDSR